MSESFRAKVFALGPEAGQSSNPHMDGVSLTEAGDALERALNQWLTRENPADVRIAGLNREDDSLVCVVLYRPRA